MLGQSPMASPSGAPRDWVQASASLPCGEGLRGGALWSPGCRLCSLTHRQCWPPTHGSGAVTIFSSSSGSVLELTLCRGCLMVNDSLQTRPPDHPDRPGGKLEHRPGQHHTRAKRAWLERGPYVPHPGAGRVLLCSCMGSLPASSSGEECPQREKDPHSGTGFRLGPLDTVLATSHFASPTPVVKDFPWPHSPSKTRDKKSHSFKSQSNAPSSRKPAQSTQLGQTSLSSPCNLRCLFWLLHTCCFRVTHTLDFATLSS